MPANAREVAVVVLRENLFRGGSLNDLFKLTFFQQLSSRDQTLVKRLVDGVLRNLLRLDYYVSQNSTRPIRKIDEVVLLILRVSFYELEFLRIPEYATLSEAGRLCHQFKKVSAKSFVNAVLRSFQRNKPELPSGTSAQELSITFSHPIWLIERYLSRWGTSRTTSLLRRNNELPEPVVWVNPFKTDMESFQRQLAEDEIGYSIVAGASNALTIHSKVFFRHPLYQEGTCFFMDPSSQNIPALAELDGCRRLGDFCSAPGGKSFVLASRMPREALLIASDFSQSRLLEMKSRSELCGIERIELVQADLARSAPFERSFDFVLTDVPCSGLGTIRSNPDIRWRVQPESLTTHQKRQLSILENGFSVLKEGGEILYSTCSTEPEENEHVIESFLSTCREARLVEPYFRTYPNQSAGDTFFAARVRRLGSACGKLHN